MISESKILSACGITSIVSTVIHVDSYFFEIRRNIQINPKSNITTDTTKQNRIEYCKHSCQHKDFRYVASCR